MLMSLWVRELVGFAELSEVGAACCLELVKNFEFWSCVTSKSQFRVV